MIALARLSLRRPVRALTAWIVGIFAAVFGITPPRPPAVPQVRPSH